MATEHTRGQGHSHLAQRWGGIALTVGAVLGTLCLVATTVSLIFGIRPVIFETGSMAPAIDTGSLGLSRTVPVPGIRPGDVVGVVRDDGVRVTHRVVSIDSVTGNSASLTLRGDANVADDPQTYVVTTVDQVLGTVPILGYVVVWLKNPYTMALQGLAVVFLLAVAFAPQQGWRNSPTGWRLVSATAAVTVVALAASGVGGSGDAQAALNTQALAAGTVTAIQPPNTTMTCTNVGTLSANVRLSWPNPPANARFSYQLTFSGKTVTLAASGLSNPAQYTVDADLVNSPTASFNGRSGFVITMTTVVGNFRSTGVTQQISGTAQSTVPAGIRCGASASGAEMTLFATPSTTTPSSSASSSAPSESSTSSSESATSPQPSSSTPPVLPPGGTLTSSGAFAYYRDDTTVTIRNAANTDVEFRGRYPTGSHVRWLPRTQILEVTEPDGTVITVKKVDQAWVAKATAPTTQETPPSTQPGSPTTSTVPEAPNPPVVPMPPTSQESSTATG